MSTSSLALSAPGLPVLNPAFQIHWPFMNPISEWSHQLICCPLDQHFSAGGPEWLRLPKAHLLENQGVLWTLWLKCQSVYHLKFYLKLPDPQLPSKNLSVTLLIWKQPAVAKTQIRPCTRIYPLLASCTYFPDLLHFHGPISLGFLSLSPKMLTW